MRRIGVVVNPIAGMGGRVGLKGTDGKLSEARRRGAEPRAPERARRALEALGSFEDVELYTYGDPMGESIARDVGFEPTVVGTPNASETSAADTRDATRALIDAGVDLLLFVGGDGTAVDVAGAIDAADSTVPMLGVPAGVKVYSSVFGVDPEAAGRLAGSFDRTERREVNDIDEDAYRGGDVETTLRAVVETPVGEELQSSKQIGGGNVDALAEAVAEEIRNSGATYVLGPGSTVGAIADELGVDGTPLGVDVYRDGELIVRDASESQLLEALGERNVIVVSPIGGQGFVFGRGNDQISPAVIRRCEIEIVASPQKLADISALRVDTGDPDLDESLRGWQRVRVGRYERQLLKIV